MHLAPRGDLYSMGDSNPAATFGYVAEQLGRRGIAFIAARESVGPARLGPELKRKFGGIYIANEGFSFETANRAIAAGEADAVAFGKLFIANPDLPRRFALGAPLNRPEPSTFYGSGPRGYTDYLTLDGADVAAAGEMGLAVA
jgi:2,4-dienoyl-CoA reductase-like NADH-dependent reductase (Old Yellow Enzyme family)